jgi:predicted permease
VVASKTKAKSKHLSAGALALAILGALLALGALAWAVARWLALEPRWTVSLMYSLREANYRASATWAEFSDWVRLGR